MIELGGAQPQDQDLIKDVAERDFMKDVIEASRDVPVIVDFWAPWCGPCKTLGPMLEQAVRDAKGAVKMAKVNVDEAPKTSSDFGIRSIPTLLFFQDGEPLFEMVGMVPKPVLERELRQLVESEQPEA